MQPVEEIAACDAGPPGPEWFEREVRPRYRPVVLRGVAAHWPLVQAAARSPQEVIGQVVAMDSGAPAEIMVAPPSERGRFFYGPDMRGFNFRREKAPLAHLAQHLLAIAGEAEPIGIYAGAAPADLHVPRFSATHPLPLVDGMGATARLWLGNATQAATHFDLSDNFAVVVCGRRRFTLFPPEQVANLYVGPLDVTLAGQPVSMADPLAPDLARFPRYAEAEPHGLVAELEPGDALYIPTLWWHHVAAQDPVNLMVNYWHNDVQRGGGFLAMVHAMLAVRDLPAPQRAAWRAWFDHFVFGDDASEVAAHLPPLARGVTGPPSTERDERIRRFVLQVLGSG
ncbi:cupin-like domain-containing protein [Alteraurantiacibacter buctensis]|uniref:Cupin-like domain-containing protein n=1 Tax=Alteraurantiacibacter buctensis TaxID=1503981 RepID=A0A844YW26_9SPHN|nr:cupin-like domain-containing protein [Alteraurantiacibacter buctensis]MXO70674.1 cupin-like domain-containing protein [Alteraurantiacibacter buctensis]